MTKLIEAEPSSFEEIVNHREWKDVMNEDYRYIMKNGFWQIVPSLEDKYVVTSKWIYKIKHAADGTIDKYKARFVARGFSQIEDICSNSKIYNDLIISLSNSIDGMEHPPNGCQDRVSEWHNK